jgi:hypothetical protein
MGKGKEVEMEDASASPPTPPNPEVIVEKSLPKLPSPKGTDYDGSASESSEEEDAPSDGGDSQVNSERSSRKRDRSPKDGEGGNPPPPRKRTRMDDPSDPSSDSDLDPSDDDWSINSRHRRFLAKKQLRQQAYEQALSTVRHRRKEAPKIEVLRMKRPEPNKPTKYDGTKSKWATWWSAMVDYLEETRIAFPSDVDKIRCVGSFLTDQARHWYDCRKRRMEATKGRGVDSYSLFVNEMKQRFSDPQFKIVSRRKMMDLKYSPSKGINTYLTDLTDANLDVEMTGISLICLMREQVPFDIWSRIPNEAMIEDPEEYMYLLRNQGVSYENSLENYKAIHGHYPAGTRAASSHGSKEEERGGKKNKKDKKKGSGKEEKPQGSGEKGPSKAQKPKGPKGGNDKEKRPYRDPKEWFKGISREEQQKRRDRGHCTHCDQAGKDGKPPHVVWDCPNSIKAGSYEPKASAAKKRKRDGDEGKDGGKKQKDDPAVAAITGPRIVELGDSDNESDFSFAAI